MSFVSVSKGSWEYSTIVYQTKTKLENTGVVGTKLNTQESVDGGQKEGNDVFSRSFKDKTFSL